MNILEMPTTPAPSDLELYIERNQVKVQSFSQLTQIQRNPGDRWIGKVTLPLLNKAQAAEWLGFFDALDGYVNSFRMEHPDFKGIRGVAPNTSGSVNGANQTGLTLNTKGWPASKPDLFRRGDMIQVGNKLKRITSDIASDSAGIAVLSIAPAFYAGPLNNITIITQNTSGVFRLSDGFVAPTSDFMSRHNISFAIEEVLP